MSRDDIITECGKALWAHWARITDPSYADRRWSGMKKLSRQRWIDEAKACIATYDRLRKSK